MEKRDHVTYRSSMHEVYCEMCELKRIHALRKCSPSCKNPYWVGLLEVAIKKFDEICLSLTTEGVCDFDFKYAGLRASAKRQVQDAILDFSDSILRCQVFFPGLIDLCEHLIVVSEHLNMVCMHCRTFQTRIMIQEMMDGDGDMHGSAHNKGEHIHIPVAEAAREPRVDHQRDHTTWTLYPDPTKPGGTMTVSSARLEVANLLGMLEGVAY